MKNINEISNYDYGYGELENKLISLLSMSGPPDFETADELIRLGADLNAEKQNDDDNILSRIIRGYQCWQPNDVERIDENTIGEYMIQVIHYFLDHGFDVKKKNGRYGAQCLYSIVLSVQDRSMIEATKLLISAGAEDLYVDKEQTEGEKPKSFLDAENCYQRVCEYNYHAANIIEATYQIYKAIEEKKSYIDIDSYEAIIGKTITKVLIEKPKEGKALHDVMFTNGRFGKCFYTNIYFLFNDRMLIATPYNDFWTDKSDSSVRTLNISSEFSQIIGATVEKVEFAHNGLNEKMTHYTQPVTTFIMSNGNSVSFSTSFGEVPKDKSTAYYYFGEPIIRKEDEPGIEFWWC